MKKVIIILLAVFLVASVAGCGTSSKAPSSSQTSMSDTVQATTEKTHPGWFSDEVVEVDVMLNSASSFNITNDIGSLIKLKELKGVQINMLVVPSSDYDQKKATLMATDDVPDIMLVSKENLNTYGREGSFYDVTSYIDGMKNFKALYEKVPEVKFQLVDGKFYGFPTLSRYDILRGSTIMIRKDIFEANNIAIPQTFDEFYGVLKKLKELYPDKIPYICRNGSENLMGKLGYSMGSGYNLTFDPNVNGGSYVYEPAYEPTREVLEFLSKMYKEKLLDPDFTSITSAQWQEKIANGKGLVYYDNPTMAAYNLGALREIEPNAEWSPIMMPKNSYGYSRGLYSALHQLNRIWGIGSGTPKEKVDIIVQMFDWLYSDEGCDLFSLGVEGEDFIRESNGEINFTDTLIKKYTRADGTLDSEVLNAEKGIAGAYSLFVPYSDMHSYQLMWPQFQLDWYKNFLEKEEGFTFPAEYPPMTQEESDRVATLQTALNTESQKMYDNIILGVEGIEQFDKYVETFNKIGYKELEQIMNTARARALNQ